jgi:integrase
VYGDLRTPGSLYYHFKRLIKKAGLPDRRFHDLRHTAATILLLRGVNVKLVSEMLGHSDITMTLRVYGHLLPHTHEQAAVMMDEVFARRAQVVR